MMEEINQIESKLTAKRMELQRIPGLFFIQEVAKRLTWDLFSDPADLLAEELTNRDEPMLASDIKAVFQASGFDYTDRHIDAAHPDNQDTVNEQLKYYRE